MSKLWFIWKFIPHSHDTKDMTFLGVYNPGEYEVWECNRCRYKEML